MIVTCEQCQARFKLADEKLKAEGTKVRCSKCQRIFTVFPVVAAPAAPLATAAPPATDADSTPVTAPAESAATEPETETAAPDRESGGLEFDFGEQSPSSDASADEESFSFAGPAAADNEAESPAPAADFATREEAEPGAVSSGFDFDSAFAEETETAAAESQGPVEFDFGSPEMAAETATDSIPMVAGEFDFAEGTAGDSAPGEFSFAEDPAADDSGGEFNFAAEPDTGVEGGEAAASDEFDLAAENVAAPAFGEVSFDAEADAGFSFSDQPQAESPAFAEEDNPWGEPAGGELGSFDFDEPNFENSSPVTAPEPKDASLSFGEIDFSDGDETETGMPSFDSDVTFSQPLPAPAPSAAAPPPPPAVETPVAPPPPRQPASRPRSDAPISPAPPRRSPVSTMVVGLGVLLVALCGAGGYLYLSGDGERLIGQLVTKIKGEEPAGPVEQRIGLNISGSSYVNNREAGQLLVVQGTAVNNFSTTRSAISVKGLLLDGSGKVVQQQTVFCGNPLSEEKLRTLKFAEIEEAMSNQFGDSLSNMNVKAGTALKFTIVFRNVPKEMANINVEVVDSKPGAG